MDKKTVSPGGSQHSMQRFPYLLVIGDREMQNNEISVRKRGGQDLGSMSIEAFVKLVIEE